MSLNSHPNRFAVFLAQVTLLGVIALPLSAVAIWLFWDQFANLAIGNLQHPYDVTDLSLEARLAGCALFLFGACLQAYGLLGVRQTFLEAAKGNALSARSVEGFRRFAWVSLSMVFVGIAQHTGLIILFSLSDPAHQGALSVQVGSEEVKALFMALLLVFIAHVFAEGRSAKEENETFL
ncbi:MAG: DUF2975 domain-containing protein [Sneathiella sp.]